MGRDRSLVYVCDWAKDRENSWSGTHMGLYRALQEEFRVVDYDVSLGGGHVSRILRYAVEAQNKVRGSDLGRRKLKGTARAIRADRRAFEGGDAFCFEEMPIAPGCRSWIYQDLNVGYIKKLAEDSPGDLVASGYGGVSSKEISAREREQRRYYGECAGIFTMGRWLERYLVESYGLPPRLVHHAGGGQCRRQRH